MDGGAIYKWVHEELIAKVKAAYHDKLAEEKKKCRLRFLQIILKENTTIK